MIRSKKIPFSPQALAQGGHLVCRCELFEVVDMRYHMGEPHELYPVKAKIRMINSPRNHAFEVSYTLDGRVCEGEDDSWDLMLEVDMYQQELWVNLYTKPGQRRPMVSEGYPTEHLARSAALNTEMTHLGTIRVWDSNEGCRHENH